MTKNQETNTGTWTYWTDVDEGKHVPDEYVWERLRHCRNMLLNACDYRMVTDAPWDQAAWTTYRQALRDLPDVTTDPRVAVWPAIPA
jgi:hypothetical protein